jgi:hypothetical protein
MVIMDRGKKHLCFEMSGIGCAQNGVELLTRFSVAPGKTRDKESLQSFLRFSDRSIRCPGRPGLGGDRANRKLIVEHQIPN